MFIKNEKIIKIIGYPESSMTEEYCQVFLKEGLSNFDVILPEDFISLSNKENYQYIIAFWLDIKLRKNISDLLDNLNLDCVTYINDSSYTFTNSKIGRGSFVAFDGLISWNCDIGNHCYFGTKSGIGHDVVMGKNCIVSPGVLIGGRTVIGNNCMFMFKSSVLNKLIITDNVTLGSFSNFTKNVDKPGNYVGSIARLVKCK
jgi:NDP-sugar pyrophosphorylase family protein